MRDVDHYSLQCSLTGLQASVGVVFPASGQRLASSAISHNIPSREVDAFELLGLADGMDCVTTGAAWSKPFP